MTIKKSRFYIRIDAGKCPESAVSIHAGRTRHGYVRDGHILPTIFAHSNSAPELIVRRRQTALGLRNVEKEKANNQTGDYGKSRFAKARKFSGQTKFDSISAI